MKRLYIMIILFSILMIGCSTKSERNSVQNNAYNTPTINQTTENNEKSITNEKLNNEKINNGSIEQINDDQTSKESSTVDNNEDVTEDKKGHVTLDQDAYNLHAIFPNEKGYGWRYNGSYDSGREESIIETSVEDNIKYIVVQGEEDDMSDGESGKDYGFKKIYKIMEDGIMIRHEGAPEYMDNAEYYLLKRPIKVGNAWEHPWYEGAKARTEIIEVSDNRIIIQTERLDNLEDASIKQAKTTLELGKGIILEEKILFDDIEFVSSLDYYGQNLRDWLGYFTLVNDDKTKGYLNINAMKDDYLEFSLKVFNDKQDETLANMAKIDGNQAVFEGIIQLGEGEDSKNPIKVTFERLYNQIRVITDGITLQISGSQASFDGIYIKQ